MTKGHAVRLLAAAAFLSGAVSAHAFQSTGLTVRERGFAAAGGIDPSRKIQYYALHTHVGLTFWGRADRWLAARGITALWVIEPWVALVSDHDGKHGTDTFEIGVNPLLVRMVLHRVPLAPFVEGGEGILYTDLRGRGLGTRVQFSSQIGAGLEYRLRPDLSLTLAGRFRHISNAGLTEPNSGVETIFGLLGFTFK
jgi:hypothetical protein